MAGSLVVSTSSITIGAEPILRKGSPPADDLVEAVYKCLHGWKHGRLAFHRAWWSHSPQKRIRKIFAAKGRQREPRVGFAVGIVEKIFIFFQ